ncbi:MAG: alpha-amylase family glycosyl hydrolase, partial [Chloroflexota bacterium]
FNFPLMRSASPLSPAWIRKNQKARLALLEKISPVAWPCNTLGNHDSSRVYSHFADGTHDAERARLALASILTLKGTPFIYNGEEIGMTDYQISDPAQLRDTMATWYYQRLVDELNVDPTVAASRAAASSRDKNRTPMQWCNTHNAGFSPLGIQTWLPVNPNYSNGINVRDQRANPVSLWNFYRRMLRLRKNTPALIEGDYTPVHASAEGYLAFLRSTASQNVLVVLSFSKERLNLNFSDLAFTKASTLFSSAGRSKPEEKPTEIHLGAFEIYIAERL